jgi:hypothetical protein
MTMGMRGVIKSGCKRIGERDRPGRPGWRLASQSPPDSALANERAAACRKSFRRDAENSGRDDRAPQTH